MFGLFAKVGEQELVTAHGKEWLTLYRVGPTRDFNHDIWIAAPADSVSGEPMPCSAILVAADPERAKIQRETEAKHQAELERMSKRKTP